MRKYFGIWWLLLFVLAGCGQATPAAPAVGAPTTEPSPTAVAPPTAAPSPAATAPDALVEEARQRLATQLGVEPVALALQTAEAREWPDGALGCPDPEMMYPQVITPGYLLVFSHNHQTYDVHTDEGQVFILCENEQPTPLTSASDEASTPASDPSATQPQPTAPSAAGSQPPTLAAQPIVQLAREKLASDLGVPVERVTVVEVQGVEWRDGSLGCPQPGMLYPQVITPGYRVTLEADGKTYNYHTDLRRRAVRCDNPALDGALPSE